MHRLRIKLFLTTAQGLHQGCHRLLHGQGACRDPRAVPWQLLINRMGHACEQSVLEMCCSIACLQLHCPDRRDKYCRSLREYWVDTQTHGKFTSAENEEIRDTTIAEGEADSFILGGIEPSPMRPDGDASEDEDDDQDTESDEPKKGGSKAGVKRHVKFEEVAEEHALEAHCCKPADAGKTCDADCQTCHQTRIQ